MTDERHPASRHGDADDGGEEPRDTRAAGYPTMPPLAEADPEVRGEEEAVDSGWAGAAQAAEGETEATETDR